MPRAGIVDACVCRGRPSLVAAPAGPDTRPRHAVMYPRAADHGLLPHTADVHEVFHGLEAVALDVRVNTQRLRHGIVHHAAMGMRTAQIVYEAVDMPKDMGRDQQMGDLRVGVEQQGQPGITGEDGLLHRPCRYACTLPRMTTAHRGMFVGIFASPMVPERCWC